MNTQTKKKGAVTRNEYNALLERIEDLEDAITASRAQESGSSADAWSSDLVQRMLDGERPLRLWREHRGMSKRALSKKTNISESYLSEIETGKKPGSVTALSKCAKALGINLDDLVTEENEPAPKMPARPVVRHSKPISIRHKPRAGSALTQRPAPKKKSAYKKRA